jgi:hypothetical protein
MQAMATRSRAAGAERTGRLGCRLQLIDHKEKAQNIGPIGAESVQQLFLCDLDLSPKSK